ncbi:MAG: TIGR02453 family protein, partial [Bacteroidota bacterium]
MSMIYFTNDTIYFLQGLAENNNASWFNNNKRLFEERVKMPFQNFIEDVCQELEKFENLPMAAPKDCIFRLNRDTRFSEDKSPYKTFVSALVSPFGRQNKAYPGMYIQISGSEVRLYSGSHDLTPEQLKFVRQKIYDEPKKFERIISDKEFIRVFREI